MVAVDTNILVRLLTKDDPEQVKRAVAIMKRSEVFIPKTVLLETEWVLRHAYEIERGKINEAPMKLAPRLRFGTPSGGREASRAVGLADDEEIGSTASRPPTARSTFLLE